MFKLVVATCLLLAVVAAATAEDAGEPAEMEVQSSYIVHVAPAHAPPRPSRPRVHARRAYASFLSDHLPAHLTRPAPSVHYSYAHAATGFAARLTSSQAAHLRAQPSVLAVVPDVMLQLHTTMTPSFLGLGASSELLTESGGASDVVIGVIDSGVYPKGRASFAADPSLPPPPSTFRGSCVSTPSFNGSAFCNNKLVGAKFFHEGYEALLGRPIDETEDSVSPLDTAGHGTHTASTAAGSAAVGASFYKYGKGTAVGAAPGARIASYKACWTEGGCGRSDVLAAMEEAIADGVDVISMSVGFSGQGAPEFHEDPIAVGAFNALRKGIIISASAGNDGPRESTAGNLAPWILTVGASTMNRRFPDTVVLGNGDTFTGTSLYAGPQLGATEIPLVKGEDAGSFFCKAGELNTTLVAGKIVLCGIGMNSREEKGEVVKLAGGAGLILVEPEEYGQQAKATSHVLPATTVTFAAAKKIMKYVRESASPVATILFHGTVIDQRPSFPRMASFSSRGPNIQAPEILKPDVTAPGVDILAAWSGLISPTRLKNDTRRVRYNILSGTSMSCPLVSGIAAMLRQARPDWSPAAIKSALMTTAYVLDNTGNVIREMSTSKASTPFAHGAGHVDANRALDPGLVYDADANDYIAFLCALGYTTEQIAIFREDGSEIECPMGMRYAGDLNYPAFSVVFNSDDEEIMQHRVVRNVGSNVRATYTVSVTSPAGVLITVKPRKLRFSARRQTQEFEITFAPSGTANVTEKYTFGSIVWSDGEHKVRSPIAITWPESRVATM